MGSGKKSESRENLRFNPLENIKFALLGTAMSSCVLLLLIPLLELFMAENPYMDLSAILVLGIGSVIVFFLVFTVVSVLQLGTMMNIIAKDLGEIENK